MAHHGAGLRRILQAERVDAAVRERLIDDLCSDHRRARISPEDAAMLDYAVKLTETPASIERADVENLRRHGFDDRAIHDVCAIAAYFAFVNRIADGLGVELE